MCAQRSISARTSLAPHHPSLRLPLQSSALIPESPFEPGSSPFHIKGTVVCGLLEYVASRSHADLKTVCQQLPSEALKAFCSQTFLSSGWYDFLAILHLLEAAARVSEQPTERFIAEHARWQAERDVRGIYKVLFKLSTAEAVAERFPAAFTRYFDFAQAESSVTKGCAVITLSGMPSFLCEWYRVSIGSAATRVLEMTGACNIQSEYSAPIRDGAKAGIPTVKFNVRRTWSAR